MTTATLDARDPFEDSYEFQDEIIGEIRVNEIERDLVDTPEFQRLFRTSQLGFVDFVYPCANHTRGVHSIGCCYWAKRLIRILNDNRIRFDKQETTPEISRCESILIGIGALLHDISHGPYAHDIEKKSHEILVHGTLHKIKSAYGPYEKHDDYVNNPVLYLTLLDQARSHVARVLARYSRRFWDMLQTEKPGYPQVAPLVESARLVNWDQDQILGQLVFHLLVFEKSSEAQAKSSIEIATTFDRSVVRQWGLGPEDSWSTLHRAWYQPYRHDIIGDTLSADLLDYLHRDARRLNITKTVDLRLLKSYTLVSCSPNNNTEPFIEKQSAQQPIPFETQDPPRFRCAIDLNDRKRRTIRTERLNDLFRLLDLRYEIHEKAVFHRVTQAAIAMSSRAVLVLPPAARPTLEDMYGFSKDISPALCGEDRFLELLIRADKEHGSKDSDPGHSHGLPAKLAERRVYRPLMVVPGDRVRYLLTNLGDIPGPTESFEPILRELAALVDSEHFKPFFCFVSKCIEDVLEHATDTGLLNNHISQLASSDRLSRLYDAIPSRRVIFWVTPYKQLHKDPAISVCVNEEVTTLDRLMSDDKSGYLKRRVEAGMLDTEMKYASMWKMYVFLSDGLFYSGVFSRFMNMECSRDATAHKLHLEFAQELIIRALRAAWHHWAVMDKRLVLQAAMEKEDLSKLLKSLSTSDEPYNNASKLREDIATVPANSYLHGSDNSGHSIGNCRDIRYKYSVTSAPDFAAVIKGCNCDPETEQLIIEIFNSVGLTPQSFSREECMEVIGRLRASPKRLRECMDAKKAARGEAPVNREMLQRIWREPEGNDE